MTKFLFFLREKKREREREELWKRLHELADEIQKTPSLPSAGGATGQSTNSDGSLNSTSTSNQNNTQQAAASSAQSHSAGPTAISTQMNSMSISGAAAMSK